MRASPLLISLALGACRPDGAPVLDQVSTDEDTPVVVAPLANDGLDGPILGVSPVVARGTLDLATGTYDPRGAWDDLAEGVPGIDVFTYLVDAPGGEATGHIEVTVWGVNDAPVAVADAAEVDRGDEVTLDVAANDVDPDQVGPFVVALVSTPAGGAAEVVDGKIVYRHAGGNDASDAFRYTIVDAGGVSAEGQVDLTVVGPPDELPTLDPIADQAHAEGEAVEVLLTAWDPEGAALSFAAEGLPPELSIDADSGVVAGVLPFSASEDSPYAVTVRVSDGSGADAQSFLWSVENTDRAPVIDEASDLSLAEGEPMSVALTGHDPDGDAAAWSAEGLPPGLAIDAATGEIAGVPSFDSAGDWPVTVTLTAGDLATTVEVGVFVAETNRAPQVTGPTTYTWVEGQTLADFLAAYGAVDPDADALSWQVTGAPGGVTVAALQGQVSGVMPYDAASGSPYAVQIRVTDPSGASATLDATWTVTDTPRPPVLSPIPDRADSVGTSVSVSLSGYASDPDGDVVTWSAVGLPAGVSLTSAGAISGALAASSAGTYTVTVTASAGGQSASDAFVWTVSAAACSLAFTDVTSSSGLSGLDNRALIWLDLENDGDQDLFVHGRGVFRNNGLGAFTAYAPGFDPTLIGSTHSYGLGDFDNDGDLDLFIGGELRFGTVGNRLLFNDGAGQFVDVTGPWGAVTSGTTAGGTAAVDFNRDNWLDLGWTTEFNPPHLWRNSAGAGFVDQTSAVPVPFQADNLLFADLLGDGLATAYFATGSGGVGNRLLRWTGASYINEALPRGVETNPASGDRWGGAHAVDLDGDGDLDLHVITGSTSLDHVHLNDGSGVFTDQQPASVGLPDVTSAHSASWADADLDGDLDVFLPQSGVHLNDGAGHFISAALALGANNGAWADVDGDGDLDLVAGSETVSMRLWRNEVVRSGCLAPGSVEVRALTDRDGDATDALLGEDRDAIGAEVWVDLDGDGDFAAGGTDRLTRYTVGPAMSGRKLHNQLALLVGLGASASVDLRVRFPDGTVVTELDVPRGDVVEVRDR